jgi:hypothetical protein
MPAAINAVIEMVGNSDAGWYIPSLAVELRPLPAPKSDSVGAPSPDSPFRMPRTKRSVHNGPSEVLAADAAPSRRRGIRDKCNGSAASEVRGRRMPMQCDARGKSG